MKFSFSRTPGNSQNSQESPDPGSQASQEGANGNGFSQDGRHNSENSDSLVTSPVQFITQVDPSAIGIQTLPFSYGEGQHAPSSNQDVIAAGQNANHQQHQQQVIIGNAQQQQS